MTAIAVLRPVDVVLVERNRRAQRHLWTILWRDPAGKKKDSTAGLTYRRARAEEMARLCGAKEIIIEEDVREQASPAPRLADFTFADVQELQGSTESVPFNPPRRRRGS